MRDSLSYFVKTDVLLDQDVLRQSSSNKYNLNRVDKDVREKAEMLMEQMAEQWCVTEELKI